MKLSLSAIFIAWLCLYTGTALAESENLSAAVTDVAGKKICDRLKNRFRGLQSNGESGKSAYIGTLWVRSCEVTYDESHQDHMTLKLGLNGWRWLNRDKDVFGAGFSTDEYARFEVAVALSGKVVAKYEPTTKRLAMWFKPQARPKVNFKTTGDVDIDKESMWGSALAGAATLIGQSPDTMADEKLAKKGEQRFVDKLAGGFSAAIDFCTGNVISELGQPKQQAMFHKLDEKQQNSFKNVALAPSTFLLFGPYGEHSDSLNLVLSQENSDNFKTKLICEKDAVRLGNAYMAGNDRTPEVPSLKIIKEKTNDGDVSLISKNEECPVVVMIATDKSVKKNASFKFKVQDKNEPKPLAMCK